MVEELEMTEERKRVLKYVDELCENIKWVTTNHTLIGICMTPIQGIEIVQYIKMTPGLSEEIEKMAVMCLIKDRLGEYIDFARNWNNYVIDTFI